jgi:hypothetical protein
MRGLTDAERAALSPGLADALHRAGARPRIIPRASPLAHVARLWRGAAPIMALGQGIWWQDAPDDLSRPGLERQMSILQHELQHVLEYASGELSLLGYALLPFNWTYRYRLDSDTRWSYLGAEQRAQLVQDYWLAERRLAPGDHELGRYRRVIPWAAA